MSVIANFAKMATLSKKFKHSKIGKSKDVNKTESLGYTIQQRGKLGTSGKKKIG